jgi:ADP-ribose pyrophosphatase YjhB (NUDIX family)
MSEHWLEAALRLRAIAQTGREYSRDPYDLERFVELAGLAESLIARLAGETPARIGELFLPERGYPTPKVDVRAGVFRDDAILLVRETSDGRWALPGGWADERESPREAIEREVREEAGLEVVAAKLVAVKDRSLHGYAPRRLEHVYKLFFLCSPRTDDATLRDWQGVCGIETSAAGFFPLSALPELSFGRTLEDDIGLLAAHRREPALPTYFD